MDNRWKPDGMKVHRVLLRGPADSALSFSFFSWSVGRGCICAVLALESGFSLSAKENKEIDSEQVAQSLEDFSTRCLHVCQG